jgi:hypothetical protein
MPPDIVFLRPTNLPLTHARHHKTREAPNLVRELLGRGLSQNAGYWLRRRQAMRDCSDHSSMKPGEALCENRPPDSPKEASAWS